MVGGRNFYILDSGIFFDVARCIFASKREEDNVFYFNFAEKKAFPRIEEGVGFGHVGIKKLYAFPWARIFGDVENSFFIFTDVGFNFFSDLLRMEGFNVFVGFDLLEEERRFTAMTARDYGVKVANFWVFKKVDEIKANLASLPEKLVLKVSRTRGTVETRIFSDKESLVSFVEAVEREVLPFIGYIEWLIQDFVEGAEVALTAFFNGKEFIKPYFLNFEHEYGGAGWWVDRSVIMDAVLEKIRPFLVKINYRGIIDANCIVAEDGVYLLEFTVRFASPGAKLYNWWIKNFADVVAGVSMGRGVDLELRPYRFGVYCEGFRDVEVPQRSFYELNEFDVGDYGWLRLDCPVWSITNKTYGLSFFERLSVCCALGNSLDEAFLRLDKISKDMGPWVVRPDIDDLKRDVLSRIDFLSSKRFL
jgi:hypothetical protein